MFKNFRKSWQFYGIAKAITEKITKYRGFLLKLLLGYLSLVMPYLHLAINFLFQFVSDQPQ